MDISLGDKYSIRFELCNLDVAQKLGYLAMVAAQFLAPLSQAKILSPQVSHCLFSVFQI